MKKQGILNQPISTVIAGLGHTETLVIADAGLPIPAQTERIDLALIEGIPSFSDTLRAVLAEMCVERAIVAEEMLSAAPHIRDLVGEVLGDVPVDTLPHELFKARTREARAIIRTGEFTPYANIILVSGVVF